MASLPKVSEVFVPADKLGHLNAALYLAELKQAQVRLAQNQLHATQTEANQAAMAFIAERDSVSSELGVELGKTHGWNTVNGQLLPLATASEGIGE